MVNYFIMLIAIRFLILLISFSFFFSKLRISKSFFECFYDFHFLFTVKFELSDPFLGRKFSNDSHSVKERDIDIFIWLGNG